MSEGDDYVWQAEAAERWIKNGCKGVIKAVPGSGKTRAGINIVGFVRKNNPEAKIMVVVPTKQIYNQWDGGLQRASPDSYGALILTYFGAKKRYEADPEEVWDLVVFDECHSLKSAVRGVAFNLKRKATLGLSATPLGTEAALGGVFIDISWNDARIAPFEVFYVKFNMDEKEHLHYQRLTQEMRSSFIAEREDRITHDQLMASIMKRRSFVYSLPRRADLTVDLVKQHPEDRIIVFGERLEQVNEIVGRLFLAGVPTSVYTSEQDTLEEFKNHQTRVLVTSKMIKEGFDDPQTTMGIIASTPITERNHVQTVGRIIRHFPGKVATIYVLIAGGTSDGEVIANGGLRGRIIEVEGGVSVPPLSAEEKEQERLRAYYFQGKHISTNGKDLFSKADRNGQTVRVFYEPIPELIGLMWQAKAGGGKFSLHESGVYTVKIENGNGKKRTYSKISDTDFRSQLKVHHHAGVYDNVEP